MAEEKLSPYDQMMLEIDQELFRAFQLPEATRKEQRAAKADALISLMRRHTSPGEPDHGWF